MYGDARAFAGREEAAGGGAGNVEQDPRVDIGRDAAHGVVRGRLDGDGLGDGVDAEQAE